MQRTDPNGREYPPHCSAHASASSKSDMAHGRCAAIGSISLLVPRTWPGRRRASAARAVAAAMRRRNATVSASACIRVVVVILVAVTVLEFVRFDSFWPPGATKTACAEVLHQLAFRQQHGVWVAVFIVGRAVVVCRGGVSCCCRRAYGNTGAFSAATTAIPHQVSRTLNTYN